MRERGGRERERERQTDRQTETERDRDLAKSHNISILSPGGHTGWYAGVAGRKQREMTNEVITVSSCLTPPVRLVQQGVQQSAHGNDSG